MILSLSQCVTYLRVTTTRLGPLCLQVLVKTDKLYMAYMQSSVPTETGYYRAAGWGSASAWELGCLSTQPGRATLTRNPAAQQNAEEWREEQASCSLRLAHSALLTALGHQGFHERSQSPTSASQRVLRPAAEQGLSPRPQ